MLVQTYSGDYNYRLFLCKANRDLICEIDYKNINYKPYFNGYNELSFDVDYYKNGQVLINDTRFSLFKGLYHVLCEIREGDTLIKSEYFIITEPTDSFVGGKTTKQINCMASHYVTFNKKYLRGYDENSVLLYDSVGTNGVLNKIITDVLLDTWSVGTISASLNNIYHSVDISSASLTTAFKQLEHDFNCILIFDNVNKTISAYKKDEFTTNSGLYLSGDNLIDSINYTPKYDQLITRLYVYGKSTDSGNNTNITSYNITGQLYIDNFDWFIDNGYFSSSLASAWTTYEGVKSGLQAGFETALSNISTYQGQLTTLENELAVLQNQLDTIQDSMTVLKQTNHRNTSEYDTLYTQEQAKLAEITSKESDITTKQGQITSEETTLSNIATTLEYSSNFTTAQLEELLTFIYEDTLTIDTVDDAELLYDYAVEYIAEKSNPIYDLSVEIADIFSCYELDSFRDKLVLGNYVYVNFPTIGLSNLELQLVAYEHNKIDNKLNLRFSNSTKLESDLYYLDDILTRNTKSTTEFEEKKGEYAVYTNERDTVVKTGDEIDTDDNTILAGNNFINQRGFQSEDVGGDGQIQVLDDRIIFSKDSWESFYTLLSANGLYLESYTELKTTDTTIESICPSTPV